MNAVVWFSCGAASAVAAKLAIDTIGSDRVRVVNTYVEEEDEDNRRFLLDVQRWCGVTFEDARSPLYPRGRCSDVWEVQRFMSGVRGAPCTRDIKKAARHNWEDCNAAYIPILGFTADELTRAVRFSLSERADLFPILLYHGLTKRDCARVVRRAGIQLPVSYAHGFANANCRGCVKSSGVGYWNLVRRVYPDVFEDRAKVSRSIGCRLVKYQGRRIFLDELPADAKGRPRASHVECGAFCEPDPIPVRT